VENCSLPHKDPPDGETDDGVRNKTGNYNLMIQYDIITALERNFHPLRKFNGKILVCDGVSEYNGEE
jgi:hypothetical protein